jgi:uncharacterized membrane protein YphA (DoxX/SURF4 family)
MMKINTTMGTTIVPLLARLVLCAAFLTMGWNKLINDHTFHGDDARILLDLGVVEKPAFGGAVNQPAAFTQLFGQLRRDDDGDDDEKQVDEPTKPVEKAVERAQEVVDDVVEQVEEVVDDVVTEISPGRRGIVTRDPATGELVATAQRLHTVTITVYKHGGPSPVAMGWLATLTELIGGALLLIGLFTRVWGIMLACTMAVAFYLTSWPVLVDLGPFGIAADIEGGYANFNRMYVQLALFVLAFGVFLTGGGAISLDRWIFRQSSPARSDDEREKLQSRIG